MVDRIPKIESDSMRVLHKEDATDEHGGRGRHQPSQEEQEQDAFGPKLDFKDWTGKKPATTRHPSLWEKPTTESVAAPTPPPSEDEPTVEEPTLSTTITFLRATGILGANRRPQWGTISLYVFSFIGLVVAVTFVVSALL